MLLPFSKCLRTVTWNGTLSCNFAFAAICSGFFGAKYRATAATWSRHTIFHFLGRAFCWKRWSNFYGWSKLNFSFFFSTKCSSPALYWERCRALTKHCVQTGNKTLSCWAGWQGKPTSLPILTAFFSNICGGRFCRKWFCMVVFFSPVILKGLFC